VKICKNCDSPFVGTLIRGDSRKRLDLLESGQKGWKFGRKSRDSGVIVTGLSGD
jgi:hypothetical protein